MIKTKVTRAKNKPALSIDAVEWREKFKLAVRPEQGLMRCLSDLCNISHDLSLPSSVEGWFHLRPHSLANKLLFSQGGKHSAGGAINDQDGMSLWLM